jgi:hypothetical protein
MTSHISDMLNYPRPSATTLRPQGIGEQYAKTAQKHNRKQFLYFHISKYA